MSAAGVGKILGSRFRTTPTSAIIPPAVFISSRALATKLFVGGLSFAATEDGLSDAFSHCGQVVEANIVVDKITGRSKGFGFVTYAFDEEAEKALTEMNGKNVNGRVIFVDYAKPKGYGGGGLPIARGPPEPLSEGGSSTGHSVEELGSVFDRQTS